MPVDLSAIIDLVPAQWLFYALLALKATLIANGIASWLSALIKRLLGTSTANDTGARAFWFGVAHVADVVAANTSKVADQKAIDSLQKTVAAKDAHIAKQLTALDAGDSIIQRQAAIIRDSVQMVKP